jgi:hypothetical protein
MDSPRWDALLNLFSSRGIHPIIAIVPANMDPSLARLPADPDFWQRARSWAVAGAMIGLHGYSHVLRPSAGGMVPVQWYSEFVGLPLDEQRQHIADGVRLLESNGLSPEAWVAPAHGFDLDTLQALRLESDIRVISDGFMRRAVRREAFVWLPQQLWRPRVMRKGLWTICLHPNEVDEDSLSTVEAFLSSGPGLFPHPRETAKGAVDYGPLDAVFAGAYTAALRARQWSRNIGRKVK